MPNKQTSVLPAALQPTSSPAQDSAAVIEDPATKAAFDQLLAERANFHHRDLNGSPSHLNHPGHQTDRMSHTAGLEVVEYPSLDTIPNTGGWSPASNQFQNCGSVFTGTEILR